MINSRFDIQDVYNSIRNVYIYNFPYPYTLEAAHVVKDMMAGYGISGDINASSGHYEFVLSGERTIHDPSNVYANRQIKADTETFILDPKNLADLMSDIFKFGEWLEEQGFITPKGIASDKLLSTPRIIP